MKQEYDGIDGLYAGVQNMMIAYQVNEEFHGRGETIMIVSTITPGATVKVAQAVYQAEPQPARKSKKQTVKHATR